MDNLQIIEYLSSCSAKVRRENIAAVAAMQKKGGISKAADTKPWLNMHLHTFHSYNYEGWSPSRVVFECWQRGLLYACTVDFDTLAGLDETIFAGTVFNLPATGGFESRVFVPEYRNEVINSPDEPGIYYLCGKGFKGAPARGSAPERFFRGMQEMAQERNRQVVRKLNGYLRDVTVDIAKDVLAGTPSGNPTERHIIQAYHDKSVRSLGARVDLFWADILNMSAADVQLLRTGEPEGFREHLRKRLIKYGGPGYVPPREESFPCFHDVVKMTEEAGGIPTGTWLDGTNPGESDAARLLDFYMSSGIKAVTVIPERNYNITDPDEKRQKLRKLDIFLKACMGKKIPVVCGTEMNKRGQPVVDDFSKAEIAPYLPYFLESARLFFR